ncbi:MAG: ATP-binding protein [bacterium]
MEFLKIEDVLSDQRAVFVEKSQGIKRNIDFKTALKHKRIVVISGVRRAGKSTLLRQFAQKIDDWHYANFDDERFINFTVDDFQTMMVIFHKRSLSKNIIIDEIQNVKGWERFARRIHDEGYKLFISGSNAKMLSSELGTHLTGRYYKIELFPFSFKEFINFKGLDFETVTTAVKAQVLNYFDEYLLNGGFPEYLNFNDAEFLKRAYDDILYRDIVSRYGIRNVKQFKQLSHYLFTNFTRDTNYSTLKESLNFTNTTTISNYIHYLEESYLLFEVFQFDYSLKRQQSNQKKIYVIDNGLRNSIAFRFSKEYGNHLENIIFIELKRRGCDIYFHRSKKECDFVIVDKGKVSQAIQVTYSLNDANRERETKGLFEAMKELKTDNGIIITAHQDETIKIDNKRISVVSAWRWLTHFH